MIKKALGLGILLAAATTAQELPGGRDFLTDYEVDVLRERQDLEGRLAAYTKFAALRLEMVEQLRETPEAGRAGRIHRALEEYGRIVEAIDDVIDDALLRGRKLEDALEGLMEAEGRFAARLEALAGAEQEDAWRYEFVLEDAIAITRDSMELLAEDLGDRQRTVALQEEAARRRQEASMAPERRQEVRQEREAEAAAAQERERKRPSLLRPGEKLGGK